MRIFIIGFMGAGKTTLGKKLASKLEYDFIDLDDFIEKKAGMSISDIFLELGENSFRNMESENLRLLGNVQDTLISVGGGTPCYHSNMEWMRKNGLTIYLQLDVNTLLSRLKNSAVNRPLLEKKTEEEMLDFISARLEERKQYYESAELIIPARDLKIKEFYRLVKEAIIG